MSKPRKPRILCLDIETSPIEMYAWDLYSDGGGLPMMKTDWAILAICAQWVGTNEVIYVDSSRKKNKLEDLGLLHKIWKLMDKADVILTKNGKRFDEKKLKARFIMNDMGPPSPYQHIDVETMARRFGFTSYKLEYLCEALKVKHKKLKHKKFPGFELWRACLKNNKNAWEEMRRYNVRDVAATIDCYEKLKAWGNEIDPGVYNEREVFTCAQCGSVDLESRGFAYTRVAKRRKYQCKDCGGWTCGKTNLLTKEKRKVMRG